MRDHRDTAPPTKHLTSTANRESPAALPNSKRLPIRELLDPLSIDYLLTMDKGFYRTESRFLAVVAARMGVPQSDIEDMVAEAWSSVCEHRDQLAGEKLKPRLRRWMNTVLYRKVVDLRRRRRCDACESLGELEIDPIDDAAVKRAERAEVQEWLDALLEEASRGNEENLHLLKAHFFQEFSIHELARQFDLTPDAVQSRIRRLEKRVRALVEKSLCG